MGGSGPDAVMENLFAKMGDDWETFTVHPKQFHDSGSAVTVEGRYSAKHKVSGKEMDCQVCHVWTVRGRQDHQISTIRRHGQDAGHNGCFALTALWNLTKRILTPIRPI